MRARQCDRCKEFYLPYADERSKNPTNAIMAICRSENNEYSRQEIFDLCFGCLGEFEEFMSVESEVR